MTKKKVVTPSSKSSATTPVKLNISSLTFSNVGSATATATMFSPPTNIA